MSSFRVVPLHCLSDDDSENITACDAVLQALDLLETHWPGSRSTKLACLQQSSDALPSTLVLLHRVESCEMVVGHGRLARVDNNGGLITSLIVAKEFRGKQLGQQLMEALEKTARVCQLSMLLLSTPDAEGFYRRLGFSTAAPVASLGANAGRLSSEAVNSLEDMLARRGGVFASSSRVSTSVWLSKRLADESPSVWLPPADIQNQVRDELIATLSDMGTNRLWNVMLLNCPFKMQIGYSCGLTMLSVIQEYLQNSSVHHSPPTATGEQADAKAVAPLGCGLGGICDDNFTPCLCCETLVAHALDPCCPDNCCVWSQQMQSLQSLTSARLIGVSKEGEMFCIYAMAKLAQLKYHLKSTIFPLSREAVVSYLNQGVGVCVAYDKDSNHRPCQVGGNRAHWMYITGYALPQKDTTDTDIASAIQFLDQSCSRSNRAVSGQSKTALDLDSLIVIGQHGMSRRPLVTSFTSLELSNLNLRSHCGKGSVPFLIPPDLIHLRGMALALMSPLTSVVR
eukprot:GILJ01006050.1.p1 GENE.GILJ01006050.1~~GILJ01006050.1.p1  ORF type:complete len:511 (+),score=44.72 GILJ01006050.1:111-1643(+)